MTDEILKPDQPTEEFPLDLKGNAERIPLYERLSAVLHNIRVARLGEADTEEFEAIKMMADADTTELILPKAASAPRTKSKSDPDQKPSRIREREIEERKNQRVREALKSHGHRPV